ncbi:MAG: thiamine-phosphate kinase [Gammaproteobacteria bacterium]|nr:thiamine-phosphate kinase [Gammaproteobacteria bacterium]
MDEFEIIQLIRSLAASYSNQSHLSPTDDDAALIAAIDHQAIISVDNLYEGRHFPANAPPFLIGQRAVAVAVSDLAAMGARPRGCFLALSLPAKHCSKEFITAFATGFGMAAGRVAMPLLGGNLTQSDALGMSVTVVGDGINYLGRDGTQAGDAIYVSGCLGDGAAGLKYALKESPELSVHQAALRAAYYCPPQRIALGNKLHAIANSAIDISDGLLNDLQHILGQVQGQNQGDGDEGLQGRHIGAELFLDRLPYSQAMVAEVSPQQRQDYALNGGDDYELLITVAATKQSQLEELREICPLTHIGNIILNIGEMSALPSITGVDVDGSRLSLEPKGYKHFS